MICRLVIAGGTTKFLFLILNNEMRETHKKEKLPCNF